MTKIILILLLLIFGVPYLLGVIGRFLLGNRPHQNASPQQNRSSSYNASKKKRKKVIEKDEGEYIDYVEIKDK